MKYKGFILKTDEKNLSIISKYISVNKPEYAIIEFEENDSIEILELIRELHEISFDTLNCLGEDNYIYEVSVDGISKTQIKTSVKQNIKSTKWVYKHYLRYKKHFGKIIENSQMTASVSKPSISKFKPCIFVSKENKIAFNYRIKKAKEDNKPLVIFLHGGGCLGCDNIKQLFEFHSNHIWKRLKNYDCNIIMPQAPYNGAVGNFTYLDAIKQLSEYITKEVNADKNRIYIFGTSFGGHCTWESAYDYPDYYACAMPVMGILNDDYKGGIDYDRLKSIPILVAHSSNDKTVPIESNDQIVKKLKNISSDIKFIRWDKYGHRMASKFYKRENWDEWMFQQSLENR